VTTSGVFAVQKFPLPSPNSGPSGIALGPDGALWFTETVGNKIGRIPVSGAPITESTIGTALSQPISIAAGPDAALWFSETCGGSTCNGNFGKISAVASSPVQESSPPVPSTTLWGVAAGPDGAMWYAQLYNDILYRVTTDGVVTPFYLPNKGSGPLYLTTGPDGNIWFTEEFANKIGRLQ
jgi:virginiamycin B lyase